MGRVDPKFRHVEERTGDKAKKSYSRLSNCLDFYSQKNIFADKQVAQLRLELLTMLLTITCTGKHAADISYLLHKNPSHPQSFKLSFGKAHVVYSEVTSERCTVALVVEIDAVGLVRNRHGPSGEGGILDQYVNDRPYAASSLLSVAISEVFSSAMSGKSKERPDLVDIPLTLNTSISALPCGAGEEFLKKLFQPLGYQLSVHQLPLDESFPDWGNSRYFRVELENKLPLRQLLSHLYVLIPVLDNDKHYWVGDDEVTKLLHHGEGWLASHPEKEAIARRYLKHQRNLISDALARLVGEDNPEIDSPVNSNALEEEIVESAISLNEQRLGAVLAVLKKSSATRVLDLGCGEGRLLQTLLKEKQFTEIIGVDVSYRTLEIARARLHYDRLPAAQKQRLQLLHGSLIYRDQRLSGFDAAAIVEVIEHLDPPRLAAFERVIFEFARPKCVVITTPNREYNVKWETLPAGVFRHRDHRFEWDRSEFGAWAETITKRFGYSVSFLPVGQEDTLVGAPTQMAIFTE